MSENTKPNNERPADLAVQDSVGGMARRLLNPAHLRDLAGRSVKTLREQGAEQLWRDVKFRVGLAMHHDDWRHRADIPLRRGLKAQRAAHLQGPKISIIVISMKNAEFVNAAVVTNNTMHTSATKAESA